jgi:urease accessory protein
MSPLPKALVLAVLGSFFVTAPLWAHTGTGQTAGLLSGLLHPVSGLDHVVAMVAVGLWGAQLGTPAVWVLPVTFPMVMAFGGMLGLMGIGLPGIEIGIALSGVLLGVMVLLEARPALAWAAVLVGFFAIFHGHAHGTELPANQSAIFYSLGFVVSTGTLHASGIAIGLIHRWKAGRLALRVLGGVVALVGLYFLWWAVM